MSGIPPGGRILEIGCGPGNATIPFAKRGYQILAIELGERLAAMAAKNCQAFPEVDIKNMAFEDWVPEEDAFDLAFAADAFHWIRPEIGYSKAAKALKGTGSAAFFWDVPIDPGTDISKAIDRVYQDTASGFINPDKRFTASWMEGIITQHFEGSGCFGDVVTKQYFWTETLTAEQYINVLGIFSMHDGIDEEKRKCLYADIQEVIERFGGSMEKPRSILLFHARVKK
jgi:SAM-dependent methyltransferase